MAFQITMIPSSFLSTANLEAHKHARWECPEDALSTTTRRRSCPSRYWRLDRFWPDLFGAQCQQDRHFQLYPERQEVSYSCLDLICAYGNHIHRTLSYRPRCSFDQALTHDVLQARNRGSFFSRFASKKKDIPPETKEDASEAGDVRTEGIDADAFSQPIGYIPQFPSPPKYIKVRAHGRKERDFNRTFLAQELRGRTGVEIAQSGGRPANSAANSAPNQRKDGNAIWAMEFSRDGKHLAAGGRDFVVRVWEVFANKEDRQSHESEEANAEKDGERVHLSAPVFKTKTVQEYSGHTASVLDLSWSKVRPVVLSLRVILTGR